MAIKYHIQHLKYKIQHLDTGLDSQTQRFVESETLESKTGERCQGGWSPPGGAQQHGPPAIDQPGCHLPEDEDLLDQGRPQPLPWGSDCLDHLPAGAHPEAHWGAAGLGQAPTAWWPAGDGVCWGGCLLDLIQVTTKLISTSSQAPSYARGLQSETTTHRLTYSQE